MLELLSTQPDIAASASAPARWRVVQAGVRVRLIDCETAERELRHAAGMPLEIFFCTDGELKLEWEDGRFLRVHKGEALLLSGESAFAGLHAAAKKLSGVQVCADALSALERPEMLAACPPERLAEQLRRGCAVLRENDWVSSLFSVLGQLPPGQKERYCVFKLAELFYLLGQCDTLISPVQTAAYFDGRQIKITRRAHDEMLARLDEHWTIDRMAQQYHTSATLLKSCFRYLYGKPIHRYLRQRRLEHAAELLTTTSLSMVDIAAAVGYGSASQFGVSFKSFYHMSPSRYRKTERSKMSEKE